ncbi:XdhC family protein [Rhizobium sp. BK316]|uniref:XdhC family protein n=1 Tax=Rhizobium sp. BK316 TaxID=2587053 RepID=UPI0016201BC4
MSKRCSRSHGGYRRATLPGWTGPSRAHQRRQEVLRKAGFREDELARIKAPIGLFDPTRDSTSMVLSVLAEVAATRLDVSR